MAPKRGAGQQQAAGIPSKKASAGKRQLTEAVTPQLRTSKRSRTAGAPVAPTVCFALLLIIATDDGIYSPLALRLGTHDGPRLRPAEISDVHRWEEALRKSSHYRHRSVPALDPCCLPQALMFKGL